MCVVNIGSGIDSLLKSVIDIQEFDKWIAMENMLNELIPKYMNHENEAYREILIGFMEKHSKKELDLIKSENEFYLEWVEKEYLVGELYETREPLFKVKCINGFPGVIEKDKIYNVYNQSYNHRYEIYSMNDNKTHWEYCKNFKLI